MKRAYKEFWEKGGGEVIGFVYILHFLVMGGTPYVPFEMEILDGAKWEKGSFVKCTVRIYVETLLPFTSGVREESIVMMIENSAPGSFGYIPGTN